MDVRMYLTVCLFAHVWLSDASVVLSKIGSLVSRELFLCNTEVIVSCKTDVNPNVATLEINNQIVIDCQLGFCTTVAANYQNHLLTYDLATGTFNLTKQTVQFSDIGNNYKCIGEFEEDTFNATVKVIPENTTTSLTEQSGTEIKVTTGCVFPASEITISWFYYEVGSLKRSLFQEHINESTDSTSCAVGICGGNGVVTKQSTIVIQIDAKGCDYTFEVEIRDASDPDNPITMATTQNYRLSCKVNNNGFDSWKIIVIAVFSVLGWCLSCFITIYIQISLFRYYHDVLQLESSLEVKVGTDVLLQSLFKSTERAVKWFQNDDVSIQISNSPRHMLRNVGLDDAGIYKCTDERNRKHAISLNVMLTVGHVTTTMVVTKGSEAIIRCKFDGDEENTQWQIPVSPYIIHRRNPPSTESGIELTLNNNLLLKSVSKEHDGEYKCYCERYGLYKVRIYVIDPPTTNEGNKTYTVKADKGTKIYLPSSLTLTEYIQRKTPKMLVEKEEDRETEGTASKHENNQQSSVPKRAFEKDGDFLVLMCKDGDYAGKYKFSTVQDQTYTINIILHEPRKEKTSIIKTSVGAHVTLPCSFTDIDALCKWGKLSNRGTWETLTMDKILAMDEEKNVVILNVRKNDEGIYRFTNGGKGVHDVNLVVGNLQENGTGMSSRGAAVTLPVSFIDQYNLSGWHKRSSPTTWELLEMDSKTRGVRESDKTDIQSNMAIDQEMCGFTNRDKGAQDVNLIVGILQGRGSGLIESHVQAERGATLLLQSFNFNKEGKPTHDPGDLVIKNVQECDANAYTCDRHEYRCHNIHVIKPKKYQGICIGLMCVLANIIPVVGVIPLFLMFLYIERGSKPRKMDKSCETVCDIVMIVFSCIPVLGIFLIIPLWCCKCFRNRIDTDDEKNVL